MIKALIIDDEESAVNVVRLLLNKHVPFVEAHIAIGSQQGIEKIKSLKPELIFLDIEMPVMTGFEVLNQFQGAGFEVIFITAYGHYAIKAIRFSALDYLLKPIDVEELKTAVNRYVEKRKNKFNSGEQVANFMHNLKSTHEDNYKLAIATTEGMHYFPTNEIIRLEADGNYTRIFLINKKMIIASKTLKEFDEILSDYDFIRVHRTHLVNKKFVKRYLNERFVILQDETSVEVSRRKSEDVKNILSSS